MEITTIDISTKYKLAKSIRASIGVNNRKGEYTLYIGDDPLNLTSSYVRNPIWKIVVEI